MPVRVSSDVRQSSTLFFNSGFLNFNLPDSKSAKILSAAASCVFSDRSSFFTPREVEKVAKRVLSISGYAQKSPLLNSTFWCLLPPGSHFSQPMRRQDVLLSRPVTTSLLR